MGLLALSASRTIKTNYRSTVNNTENRENVPVSSIFTIDQFEDFEERAAIMEFDGGLQRVIAEQKAIESIRARKIHL